MMANVLLNQRSGLNRPKIIHIRQKYIEINIREMADSATVAVIWQLNGLNYTDTDNGSHQLNPDILFKWPPTLFYKDTAALLK